MKKNTSQTGFTLVEVLIAITILAIGILAAATMQTSSIGGTSLAIQVTNATSKAIDTHETLMSLPYTSATTDPLLNDANADGFGGLNYTDVGVNLADGGPVVQGDYTIFWNVADDYPLVNCKTIRVIVRRNQGIFMGVFSALDITVTQDFIKMRTI